VKPVSHLSGRFRVAFDDARTVPNAGLVIPLRLADRFGVVEALNRRVGGTDRQDNSALAASHHPRPQHHPHPHRRLTTVD